MPPRRASTGGVGRKRARRSTTASQEEGVAKRTRRSVADREEIQGKEVRGEDMEVEQAGNEEAPADMEVELESDESGNHLLSDLPTSAEEVPSSAYQPAQPQHQPHEGTDLEDGNELLERLDAAKRNVIDNVEQLIRTADDQAPPVTAPRKSLRLGDKHSPGRDPRVQQVLQHIWSQEAHGKLPHKSDEEPPQPAAEQTHGKSGLPGVQPMQAGTRRGSWRGFGPLIVLAIAVLVQRWWVRPTTPLTPPPKHNTTIREVEIKFTRGAPQVPSLEAEVQSILEGIRAKQRKEEGELQKRIEGLEKRANDVETHVVTELLPRANAAPARTLKTEPVLNQMHELKAMFEKLRTEDEGHLGFRNADAALRSLKPRLEATTSARSGVVAEASMLVQNTSSAQNLVATLGGLLKTLQASRQQEGEVVKTEVHEIDEGLDGSFADVLEELASLDRSINDTTSLLRARLQAHMTSAADATFLLHMENRLSGLASDIGRLEGGAAGLEGRLSTRGTEAQAPPPPPVETVDRDEGLAEGALRRTVEAMVDDSIRRHLEKQREVAHSPSFVRPVEVPANASSLTRDGGAWLEGLGRRTWDAVMRGWLRLQYGDLSQGPNYAASLQQARVIRVTKPSWSRSANAMLSHSVRPGDCYAVRGNTVSVTVLLSEPVRVTSVGLAHAHPLLVGEDMAGTAPKEFTVRGLVDHTDNSRGTLLGTFSYEHSVKAAPVQMFMVNVNSTTAEAFEAVELEVLSNHGADYTCLYRFEVYGQGQGRQQPNNLPLMCHHGADCKANQLFRQGYIWFMDLFDSVHTRLKSV